MLISLRSLVEDFPVLSARPLSCFWVAPYGSAATPPFTNGAPWAGHDSVTGAVAGTSSSRSLAYSSGIPVPTVGDAVNGRVSAYFDSTASEVFDPATLNLSGWWRADFAGAPWVANASAGDSLANGDLEANNGTVNVGTAQNGHAPADFDGTSDLRNLQDSSLLITTTAGTFVVLAKFDTAAAPSGNTYDDPAVIYESTADMGLTYTTSGFTGFVYDGAYQSKSVAAATGAYHLVMMRWDGVNLGMTIDSSAEVTQACGALIGITGFTTVGLGYGGGRIDGRILELMVSPVTLTPANYAAIKSYVNTVYNLAL